MYTYIIKKILKHPIFAILIILGPIIVVLFIIFFIIGTLTSEESGTPPCSTQSSSSGGASDLAVTHSMMQTAKAMWQECIHLGYNANQAAGICGQAHQEDPSLNVNQYNTGGDGGHGLFQITPRASGVDIEKWCPEHHENWRAPGAQVDCFNAKFLSNVDYKSSTKNASVTDCAYKAAQAEGGGSTKPDSNTSNREGGAEWFYKKFHGVGGASDVNDTANSGSGSNCSSNTSNGSDSSIIVVAKYWDNKFHGGRYGGAEVSEFEHSGVGVCTTFVSACLDKAGYGQMSSLNCADIVSHIKGNKKFGNLQGISSDQAGPGNIVVEEGHIMILMSKWYGKDSSKTKVIDMRGDPGIHGPETYHDADLSDLGNTPYFAKAVKK